jgi:hypothetical protein
MHETCTNNMSQQPIQTNYHNNLSHQSHRPNHIYSPRLITKTTVKDVSGTPFHKNDIIDIKKKNDDYTNESRADATFFFQAIF